MLTFVYGSPTCVLPCAHLMVPWPLPPSKTTEVPLAKERLQTWPARNNLGAES